MKRLLPITLIFAAVIFSVVGVSQSAVPQQINYQGYMTNPGGVPLSGTYSMVFSLCDAATGGSCPWTETQSVSVDKGIFNVALGAVTPVTLSFDSPYYLDILVNGESMSARQPLTSVGYAFRAQTADGVAAGSITNASIATGSFSNITGVGTLTDLTVSGNANLATVSGNVGIKTTNNTRASLEVGGLDGLLATGTYNSGTAQSLGAGTRMHWYPRKQAFRAGTAETTWWDDANIGNSSIAMGYMPRASGQYSTAIGYGNRANGNYSLALGSSSTATGDYAIALGRQVYATGPYSIAIGQGADTNYREGAMVIGDNAIFQTAYASCENQITMRFSGDYNIAGKPCGVDPAYGAAYRFWTAYPDFTAGVYLMPGASGWSTYSSRTRKENFRQLDGEWLLGKIRDMEVSEWNYIGNTSSKYIGPMAEEFHDAFQLNDDSTGINSVHVSGVSMAGVQALEKRTSEMKNEIEMLRAEIEALKALLAAR